MEESKFKGSPLKSTLTNTDKIERYYYLTKWALEKNPKSKFWKEAFNLIENRIN